MLYFLVMDALFFGDEAPLCGCPIAVPSLPGGTWVPDLLHGCSQWKNLWGWWALFRESQMESFRNHGKKKLLPCKWSGQAG